MATGVILGAASVASTLFTGGGGAVSPVTRGVSGIMQASAPTPFFSSFGQSVFNTAKYRSSANYNSRMQELENYHTVQQGAANRNKSYSNIELEKQNSQMKLAKLKRELYRRNHSLSGAKGVRRDSKSIVDVQESTIRQANYDAKVIKYQTQVAVNNYRYQGDMSLWDASSSASLKTQKQKYTRGQKDIENMSLLAGSVSSKKSSLIA